MGHIYVNAPRIFVLNILNGAAALDAANSVARGVRETANHPSLPLERALVLLVEICLGLSDVHHCDNALGSSGDQHVVSRIHTIDALGANLLGDVVGGPEIPILDGLVP